MRSSCTGPGGACPSGWPGGCVSWPDGVHCPPRRCRLPVGQGRRDGWGRGRGYDGGKKLKGRKRHVVVDSSGCCCPCSSPPRPCRTVTADTRCSPCCGRSSPPSRWCGQTAATPAGCRPGQAGPGPDRHDRQAQRRRPRLRRVAPQMGSGKNVRLAGPLSAAGADYERRPEHHEAMIVGHQHDHDTAVGPPAQWEPPRPRWGYERTKPQPQQKDPQAA